MLNLFNNYLLKLRQAAQPEDVFGRLSAPQAECLRELYRDMVIELHPDHNQLRVAEATEAFKLLQEWHEAAKIKVAAGTYGTEPTLEVSSRRHHYVSAKPAIAGDLSDVFTARADGKRKVVVKVVRHPKNNDLLLAEATALRELHEHLDRTPLRAHFPVLIETFRLKDESGAERQTNVLRHEAEVFSLADVRKKYPDGIDPADAAWMFNRMIAALGKTHEVGLVHGAIVPEHVLIRPKDHNGILIDWCYSVRSGEQIKAISPSRKAFYPPEVLQKLAATPATDLFMAAQCMIEILGGDVATGQLPSSVPKPIAALLRACLIPAPKRRYQNAWHIFDDFKEILERLYGEPTFRSFTM